MMMHHRVRHRVKCQRMLVVGLFCISMATVASAAGGDVCGEDVAYTRKLKKAERKKELEAAKFRAKRNLAMRAWSESVGWDYYEREFISDEQGGRERERIEENIRVIYEIDSELQGGRYTMQGDKHQKKVIYCVTTAAFGKAKENLKRRREETIRQFDKRFDELERAVQDRNMEHASRLLPVLKNDVTRQVLDRTQYTSPATGRTQNYYSWLIEWNELIDKGTSYARYMTNQASMMIDEGHLDQASGFVDEALAADYQHVQALLLRDEIEARKQERRQLLARAESAASKGRFAMANRRLAEARRIDSDDQLVLEETKEAIAGLKAQYLVWNPRVSWTFYFGLGTLGADPDAIEAAIAAGTTGEVSGGTPLSVGIVGNVRLGRQFLFSLGAGYGFSSGDDSTNSRSSDSVFDLLQATAALGYRTVRTAKRKFSFQVSGGVAYEDVSSPSAPELSDSATGFFARIAAEWKSFMLFVQHGFGFDQDDDQGSDPRFSAIWSDSFQAGIGFVF